MVFPVPSLALFLRERGCSGDARSRAERGLCGCLEEDEKRTCSGRREKRAREFVEERKKKVRRKVREEKKVHALSLFPCRSLARCASLHSAFPLVEDAHWTSRTRERREGTGSTNRTRWARARFYYLRNDACSSPPPPPQVVRRPSSSSFR